LRPGFVGRPIPGVTVQVLDDAGVLAAAGRGRLAVQSPALKLGAAAHQEKDGVLLTRDTFELDGTGGMVFLGRDTDIVKVGGVTHYIGDLEAVTRQISGVADCCAVVEGHALGNDAYDLLVTGSIDREQVMLELRQRLAPSALPRCVEIVPRI